MSFHNPWDSSTVYPEGFQGRSPIHWRTLAPLRWQRSLSNSSDALACISSKSSPAKFFFHQGISLCAECLLSLPFQRFPNFTFESSGRRCFSSACLWVGGSQSWGRFRALTAFAPLFRGWLTHLYSWRFRAWLYPCCLCEAEWVAWGHSLCLWAVSRRLIRSSWKS